MTLRRKLGTLTIGQAPRTDITPILDRGAWRFRLDHPPRRAGRTCRCRSQQFFGPKPGEALLATRMLDGTAVRLSKAAVRTRMNHCIDQLEADGCDIVLILWHRYIRRLEGEACLVART